METAEPRLLLPRPLPPLPEPLLLPNAKGGLRPAKQHYSELLTSEDRMIIERRFRREMTIFQYGWETGTDLSHPRHKSPDSIAESNACHALPVLH